MVTITPTNVTKTETVENSFIADHLWTDSLAIDGSKRDAANPSARMVLVPFAATPDGNLYADPLPPYNTRDLYAAAARIPALATAIAAVFAAQQAWHAYIETRKLELEQLRIVESQAKEAAAAATEARNAAFAARTSATDPAWVAADSAWQTASTALQTASNRVLVAAAAAEDPANPPVT